MSLAQCRRDDQIGQAAANRFFKCPAKDGLRAPTPVKNQALRIHDDDGVERCFKDCLPRHGQVARAANQLVSFLNANIQGSAKLMAEVRTRPAVVIPRIAAMITMPSIALYLAQRNDPAYQEVPQWQKDVAWIIVQRDARGTLQHIWRIPKPPELGILEREIKRVKRGQYVLIPISDRTRGHGTHSLPELWKEHLARLLQETEQERK